MKIAFIFSVLEFCQQCQMLVFSDPRMGDTSDLDQQIEQLRKCEIIKVML